MVWRNRPGVNVEQRLDEIEKTFGIKNLTDISIDETNGFLYLFTEEKKFKITMTQV